MNANRRLVRVPKSTDVSGPLACDGAEELYRFTSSSGRLPITATQRGRLERGDPHVRVELCHPGRFVAVLDAVLLASPDAVWSIVTDTANYATTLPFVKSSDSDASGNTTLVVASPFPLPDGWAALKVARNDCGSGFCHRAYRMVDGNYRSLNVLWTVHGYEPGRGGRPRAFLRFQLDVAFADTIRLQPEVENSHILREVAKSVQVYAQAWDTWHGMNRRAAS